MNWTDKSDRSAPFYVTDSDALIDKASLSAVFGSVLDYIGGHLASGRWRGAFDTVFLEVNCDTGRILLALSLSTSPGAPKIGGCAVRMQKLQDFWYDLDESGVDAAEFTSRVKEEVQRIGRIFSGVLADRKAELFRYSSSSSLTLTVYGSTPGVTVLEATIAS